MTSRHSDGDQRPAPCPQPLHVSLPRGMPRPLPLTPSLPLTPGRPPWADPGACVANSRRSFLLGAQRVQGRWARLSRSPSAVPVGPLPSRRSRAPLSPTGWSCEATNPTRPTGRERKSPRDFWKTFSPWEIVSAVSSFSKPRHYIGGCVLHGASAATLCQEA